MEPNVSSQHHTYVITCENMNTNVPPHNFKSHGYDLLDDLRFLIFIPLLCFIFQDRQVSDLAQDLATKLGLKGRKAYVSPQTESTATEGESHGETSPPTGEVGAVVTV